MEESVLDVKLVYRPGASGGNAEDGVDGGRLDDGAERLIVVDTVSLGVATNDPMGLVTSQCALGMELVLEYAFDGDDVGAGRTGHEMPCVVVDEGLVLICLGSTPVRVGQCRAVVARYGRHRTVGGGEVELVDGACGARLGTGEGTTGRAGAHGRARVDGVAAVDTGPVSCCTDGCCAEVGAASGTGVAPATADEEAPGVDEGGGCSTPLEDGAASEAGGGCSTWHGGAAAMPTWERSSSMRKSMSAATGRSVQAAKGKLISSKTTCREMIRY